MERIASFCVNHNKLLPGIYLSRIDHDVVTYDIRLCRPNCPPFVPNPTMHTIEHLFATFARNSAEKDHVIYFGPMGCRTGFYFLVTGLSHEQAIALIQEIFGKIAAYAGPVPGTTPEECGNYLEHDLADATRQARKFIGIIEHWIPEQLQYQN